MALAPLLFGGVGALTGLAGAIMQSNAQKQANALNALGLYEQQYQNDRQYRFQKQESDRAFDLQTAPRTDAYGNTVNYDSVNGFTYDLDPLTEAILGAQQDETLTSLTDDAARNRAFAERVDARSKDADERYGRAVDDYEFTRSQQQRREDPTAEYFAGENLAAQLLGRKRGMQEGTEALAKTALRTNNASSIPDIVNSADELYAGSLAETIANSKALGRAEKQQTDAYQEQMDAMELAQLMDRSGNYRAVADQFQSMAPRFTNDAERLTRIADAGLAGLTNAIQNRQRMVGNAISEGAANVGNAYSRLANGVAQSAPDLSGLARAIASIGSNISSSPAYTTGTIVDPFYNSALPSQGEF